MWQKFKNNAVRLLSNFPIIRKVPAGADTEYLTINYPPRVEHRYGYGKPVHHNINAIFDARRQEYKKYLQAILGYKDSLLQIGRHADSSSAPNFRQPWLPGLDAAALYMFVRSLRPNRYIEIGSGNSTMFARAAIRDEGLSTLLTSIDPAPRAEIDAIADKVMRCRLEDIDLSEFEALDRGDIVFFDGSHRCFTNSDVTVFFLEILPLLKPGVAVQIHDIFWPEDYPPKWGDRYYSEQYLLGCLILAKPDWMEILLPNAFISNDTDLLSVLDPLWNSPEMDGVKRGGGSFWLRIR